MLRSVLMVLVLGACNTAVVMEYDSGSTVLPDAGMEEGDAQALDVDAGVVRGVDAGVGVDAAASEPDAGSDAGAVVDAATGVDAGVVGSDAGTAEVDAGTDAGVAPRARLDPVLLSNAYCAVDSRGQAWCWNRGTAEPQWVTGEPTDTDPIVDLGGECIVRDSGEPSCFRFPGVTVVTNSLDGSAVHVRHMVEGSTWARGCAITDATVSTAASLWCWVNGRADGPIGSGVQYAALTPETEVTQHVVYGYNSTYLATLDVVFSDRFGGGAVTPIRDYRGPLAIPTENTVCQREMGYVRCYNRVTGTIGRGSFTPGTAFNAGLSCYADTDSLNCGYFFTYPETTVSYWSRVDEIQVDVTAHVVCVIGVPRGSSIAQVRCYDVDVSSGITTDLSPVW